VWRASGSLAHKMDVTLKLTQNLAYVWLLALIVSAPWAGASAIAGLAFGALPLVVSVVIGRRGSVARALVDAGLAVALAVALAAPCAIAAVTGALWARTGAFVRTPKIGALSRE
jgi:hypothetical protein